MQQDRFRWNRKSLAAVAAGILATLTLAPAPVGAVAFATVPAASPSPGEATGQDGGQSAEVAGGTAGNPVAAPAPPAPPDTSPAPGVTPSPGDATPSPGTATASPSPTASPSAPVPAPGFGAYLDYGPRGIERMSAFSDWLGGREVTVGHTYLPGDLWSNIEGKPDFLAPWARWRTADPQRTFVLNVPMLERTEGRVPDLAVASELRRGASGAYDEHFRTLARRLVDLKLPDTVIVLGWEMNGTTYTHRCGPDPESWKKYWNSIVTAMRSVPGQKFRFDFTPTRGRDATPWTDCYPGDDSVDILGMDSYDLPRGIDFDRQISEPYGLQAQVDFAKQHGKPISYPEWGLFHNGDNATYMTRMIAWMKEHPPVYQTLSDYCPHGVWQCKQNSKASEVYRKAFTGGAGTAEPAQPEPPRNCTPVNLGSWLEKRMGGRLCVRFTWWSLG